MQEVTCQAHRWAGRGVERKGGFGERVWPRGCEWMGVGLEWKVSAWDGIEEIDRKEVEGGGKKASR
jgi:hypothetical protein